MSVPFADVAELADAQVSEACDGDIVEVQVLSSAPSDVIMIGRVRVFSDSHFCLDSTEKSLSIQKICHGFRWLGVLPIRG
jgi:hypothetical protein